jgi:hypothetical protein
MYDFSLHTFFFETPALSFFFDSDYIRLVLNGQLTGGELISFCLFAQGVTIGIQFHIHYHSKVKYVFSQ